MNTETKKILLKDVFVPIITAVIGAAAGAFITGHWFSDSLIVNIDGESITVHSSQYKELVDENAAISADNYTLNITNNELKETIESLKNDIVQYEKDIAQYDSILNNSDEFDTKQIRLMNNGLERELTESIVLFYNEHPFFPLSTLADIYPEVISFDNRTLTITLGEKVPEKGYLLNVCPPYQTDNKFNSPAYMTMCGENYSYGIQMNWDAGYSYFNLNGNYSTLEFDLGHIDGGDMIDGTLQIYLDGQFAEKYDLLCSSLVQHYTLELKGAHQMQLDWNGNYGNAIINFGMANITVS